MPRRFALFATFLLATLLLAALALAASTAGAQPAPEPSAVPAGEKAGREGEL